jgi:hypothetical protein
MFEKQVVVGSKMGVAADITNNSSAPIYLTACVENHFLSEMFRHNAERF